MPETEATIHIAVTPEDGWLIRDLLVARALSLETAEEAAMGRVGIVSSKSYRRLAEYLRRKLELRPPEVNS